MFGETNHSGTDSVRSIPTRDHKRVEGIRYPSDHLLRMSPGGRPPAIEALSLSTGAKAVPTGTCVYLKVTASNASWVRVNKELGLINPGHRLAFAAPEETTTYTVVAANVWGETCQDFTVKVDNSPIPTDLRSLPERTCDLFCKNVSVAMSTLDGLLGPLYTRGGYIAEAAEQIDSTLPDLRQITNRSTINADAPIAPTTRLVMRIAGDLQQCAGALEERFRQQTLDQTVLDDLDEELLTTIVAIQNVFGSIASIALQALDTERDEAARVLIEGVPA